jgi:hypothetical protein
VDYGDRDPLVFPASSYDECTYTDEKHEITETSVDTNPRPRWASHRTCASKLLAVARWVILAASVVMLAMYHFYPSMFAPNVEITDANIRQFQIRPLRSILLLATIYASSPNAFTLPPRSSTTSTLITKILTRVSTLTSMSVEDGETAMT